MDGTTRRDTSSWVSTLLANSSGKRIFIDDEIYLTRYYLRGNGKGKGYELYLHILHKPDADRWLHNHPWKWFLSLVLQGHYIQTVTNTKRQTPRRVTKKIRWFNFFLNTHRYHTITEVAEGGTVTLVLVPPKVKTRLPWGYWNECKEVHEPDLDSKNKNSRTELFGPKKIYA